MVDDAKDKSQQQGPDLDVQLGEVLYPTVEEMNSSSLMLQHHSRDEPNNHSY